MTIKNSLKKNNSKKYKNINCMKNDGIIVNI